MHKILLFVFCIIAALHLSAQNLVVNPGAESSPAGTGWTIVSAGSLTCLLPPSNLYNNWTMVPDGSANYPYDHTTGAAGGTVFFAGCNNGSFPSPAAFELYQDIDVSADATNIDLGLQQYIFSGYIQTPVSPQTDVGFFIVDYLNGSNTILGASYNSPWQANALGSGTAWTNYSNTRLAPVGTRKVRIRLRADLYVNPPAINVYFDDISLTKPIILPVTLISFAGNEDGGKIYLNWKVADEINLSHYELEESTDAINFNRIATVASGKKEYSFVDKNTSSYIHTYYYRLKMVDVDGKFSYSNVVPIKIKGPHTITISPNPATNFVTLIGFERPGKITIINSNGAPVYSANATTQAMKINIAHLPAGLYIVRFTDGKASSLKKLVVQNK